MLTLVLTQDAGPRYLQFADPLEQAALGGSLKTGEPLPPRRKLAASLGVGLTAAGAWRLATGITQRPTDCISGCRCRLDGYSDELARVALRDWL